MSDHPTISDLLAQIEELRAYREPYAMLTQREVIEEFGVPREDLRKATRSGKIRCRRSGRRLLYCRQHVRDWLEDTQGHAPHSATTTPQRRRAGTAPAFEEYRRRVQELKQGGRHDTI